MTVFEKIADLKAHITRLKSDNQIIGFVPTMGALHQGHLSLMRRAKQECDVLIVSIFVNPTQFNNPDDFAKYPVTTEQDLNLLQGLDCDFVFLPEKEEIYAPDFVFPDMEIGYLDTVLEGKFRPGHFKGVVQVVYRLFDLVQPDKAYFGLKDFQQVAVIKAMTKHFKLPIEIIPCTTVREEDGLALSSRNLRLSKGQRFEALFISQSLLLAKNLSSKMSPSALKKQLEDLYAESSLKLEYFQIIHPESFEFLTDEWVPGAVGCIVAYVGDIRLIDNMILKD